MSPTDPQSLYTRYVELQNSKTNSLVRLGEDVYNELYELVNQALEEDSGYGDFHSRVRVAPFKLSPIKAFGLYHPSDPSRGIKMLSWPEAQAETIELEDLENQFEIQDSTSQADLRYGRKRSKIVHKPTGTVISNKANKKGSLGS